MPNHYRALSLCLPLKQGSTGVRPQVKSGWFTPSSGSESQRDLQIRESYVHFIMIVQDRLFSSVSTLAANRAAELSRFEKLSTEFDIGHSTTFLSLLPFKPSATSSSFGPFDTRLDSGRSGNFVSLLFPDRQHPSHSHPEHILVFLKFLVCYPSHHIVFFFLFPDWQHPSHPSAEQHPRLSHLGPHAQVQRPEAGAQELGGGALRHFRHPSSHALRRVRHTADSVQAKGVHRRYLHLFTLFCWEALCRTLARRFFGPWIRPKDVRI
jgi:hypothetical protein